jgi:DNA-binding NarL/FixJ family response regulator
MTVRIVIVDDHAIFREGLRAVLDGRDDIRVVGDHGDAASALSAVAVERPDLVLMDLHLPGMNGIDAIGVLAREHAGVRILVLSMLDDRPSVLAALAAGADGYVTKSAPLDEILAAIQAAARGQLVMGSDVAPHVRAAGAPSDDSDGLTLRERQLLALLADGATTERMAARLGIAEKTVRNYLSGLYLKLGVDDRTTAALAARRLLDGRAGGQADPAGRR